MPRDIPEEEAVEMLDRLLEQDAAIDALNFKIAESKKTLKDLREQLKDAQRARARLSAELRTPQPLLDGAGR